MPKLSDDTLFERALPLAIQDRIALSHSYESQSEHAKNALLEAKAMRELKGKKLVQLSEDEQLVAFNVLFCAELWQDGLAEANIKADRKVFADCSRSARLFREMRLRRWGRTKFEQMADNSVSVDVRKLMEMPLDKFRTPSK
ncbi:hypothetical protein G3A43_08715 [Paraburkholderia aspalathi]|nr:hypothetical protein [Paraburkholderia aspalathi]MBK3780339.1 hypothetical protein [Paraburkholderia aspalathi]